ncbi:MAG: glycosyltransferase [Patescibacteria group bacterium]
MNVLVDARPLVDADSRGVAAVVFDWLQRIVDQTEVNFVFVTTGWNIPKLPDPFRTHPRVTHAHIRMPNKLWSGLSMLNLVSLDRVTTKKTGLAFDKLLIGNLGFTGRITIPYTLFLHDLSFLIEPSWFSFKSRLWHRAVHCKRLICRADTLICVSEVTKRDVKRMIRAWGVGRGAWEEKKIRIFTPRIRPTELLDSEFLHHAPRPTPHAPFILAMGGGNTRKNIRTAILAVEQLRKETKYANLKLVIVGAPKRECRSEERVSPVASLDSVASAKESAKGEGARSEFIFDARDFIHSLLAPRSPACNASLISACVAGRSLLAPFSHITDLDLDTLYATASCFLYPSWYEGYGLPLHEAARFGCPCIASSTGALPETAPTGTLFVPPSKPQLWVGALRDVLEEQHL